MFMGLDMSGQDVLAFLVFVGVIWFVVWCYRDGVKAGQKIPSKLQESLESIRPSSQAEAEQLITELASNKLFPLRHISSDCPVLLYDDSIYIVFPPSGFRYLYESGYALLAKRSRLQHSALIYTKAKRRILGDSLDIDRQLSFCRYDKYRRRAFVFGDDLSKMEIDRLLSVSCKYMSEFRYIDDIAMGRGWVLSTVSLAYMLTPESTKEIFKVLDSLIVNLELAKHEQSGAAVDLR